MDLTAWRQALPEEVSVGFLDVVSTLGAVVLSIASVSPSSLACHYHCRSGLDERQAMITLAAIRTLLEESCLK